MILHNFFSGGAGIRLQTGVNITTGGKGIVAQGGQSNMVGQSGDVTNPEYPFTQADAYYWDGTTESALDALSNPTSVGGSHVTYFAEKLKAIKPVIKPVLTSGAYNGSGLHINENHPYNWSETGDLRGDLQNLVDTALTNYTLTSPLALLWCQGEQSAQQMGNAYSRAEVKNDLRSFFEWWLNLYPNAPILVSETGDYDDMRNEINWQEMRAIQRELALEFGQKKVRIAYDGAKDFGALGYMSDTVHYDYRGLKLMGEAFAVDLKRIIK